MNIAGGEKNRFSDRASAGALQILSAASQPVGGSCNCCPGRRIVRSFLKGVVIRPIHVEGLVKTLDAGVVMVAQRSVEFHPCVQKVLVRVSEFSFEVRGVCVRRKYYRQGRSQIRREMFCAAGFICAAVSYSGFSPVPISPIAAKRTELDFSGNLKSSARWVEARKSTRPRRKIRRHSHWLSGAPGGITLTRKSTTRFVLASSSTRSWLTAR